MKINLFYKIILSLFLLTSKITFAAITPPEITATGNQIYCPQTNIKIVTDVNISYDPSETTTNTVSIQISSGYILGEDILKLSSSYKNPSIIWNFNSTEGKLTLSSTSGDLPYEDFITAIKEVEFYNNSTNPSGTREFSINLRQGNLSYLPRNKHYYEYVSSPGIYWLKARDEAKAKTYYGLQGYLATLTADDEAQLAGAQAPGTGWIGGSDLEIEGTWKWVTGPEGLANGGTGTTFWIGKGTGSTTPPFNFANWNTSGIEPNNFNNDEDYAHITSPAVGNIGTWNDLPEKGNPPGNYFPNGYIVEYGGMPGDPTLYLSSSTTITIAPYPSIASFTAGNSCVSGAITLTTVTSTGNIRWYDSAVGGTLLSTGNSYTTPIINTTTTYYAEVYTTSCTNPIRTEIKAIITPLPTITASPSSRCDTGTVTLVASASAGTINWYDVAIGGTVLKTGTTYTTPSLTATTTYYAEAIDNGCKSASRTPITATVNSTPIITSTKDNSRCDVGTLVLEATTSDSGATIKWYDVLSGGISIGSGTTFTTPSITTTTTYYVEAAAVSGCTSARTEVVATVYPIVKINEEVVLCQGETATLDASIPDMIYLWSPGGETTQTIVVSTIGNYSVTISSPFIASCDSYKYIKVIEHEKPIIKEIIVNENTIVIHLEKEENYYEYSINGEYFQDSKQFSYIQSGEHTAYVREKNGCNLFQQNFTIFTISMYFTPNNDGQNDVWVINEMKDYPNSKVEIFNRYGKLLKQINFNSPGWNGTFNGVELPADDYWYRLKLDETKPIITGHFSLKR